VAHAREVAVLRLGYAEAERIHAIRLLGRTDDGAVAPLVAELLAAGKASPAERAEAARALGRLGSPGQRGLREAVARLFPELHDAASYASLLGPDFGARLTALEAAARAPGLTDDERKWFEAVAERYRELIPEELRPEAPAPGGG
jgi:hypothetical protein